MNIWQGRLLTKWQPGSREKRGAGDKIHLWKSCPRGTYFLQLGPPLNNLLSYEAISGLIPPVTSQGPTSEHCGFRTKPFLEHTLYPNQISVVVKLNYDKVKTVVKPTVAMSSVGASRHNWLRLNCNQVSLITLGACHVSESHLRAQHCYHL
jgi:hypothetical protein